MVIWCKQTYYALGLHMIMHMRILYFKKKCPYLLLEGREECVLVSMSVSLLVRVTSMLLPVNMPVCLSACLPACLPACRPVCLPACRPECEWRFSLCFPPCLLGYDSLKCCLKTKFAEQNILLYGLHDINRNGEQMSPWICSPCRVQQAQKNFEDDIFIYQERKIL